MTITRVRHATFACALMPFILWPVAVAAQAPPPPCTVLPPNIQVSRFMEPAVAALLRTSGTLQRQCAAIAAAPAVHVLVTTTAGLQPRSTFRARATITRTPCGGLRARIELPLHDDHAELLAHELEHVLEQMDGVDLAAVARAGGGAASEVAPGVFETRRAREAGLAASREVHGASDPAPVIAAQRIARIFHALGARSTRAAQRTPGPGARW